MRELLVAKLERRIEIATRIHEHSACGPMFGCAPTAPVPAVIARQLEAIREAETLDDLRAREAVAGRWYWHAFGPVPVRFQRSWAVGYPSTGGSAGRGHRRLAA